MATYRLKQSSTPGHLSLIRGNAIFGEFPHDISGVSSYVINVDESDYPNSITFNISGEPDPITIYNKHSASPPVVEPPVTSSVVENPVPAVELLRILNSRRAGARPRTAAPFQQQLDERRNVGTARLRAELKNRRK